MTNTLPSGPDLCLLESPSIETNKSCLKLVTFLILSASFFLGCLDPLRMLPITSSF
jgi:hypothetical protein